MIRFDFLNKILFSLLSSENDVALVIKYKFHDQKEAEEDPNKNDMNTKKQKMGDIKKANVVEYSYIKLPALLFGQYLEEDCQKFIDDCNR